MARNSNILTHGLRGTVGKSIVFKRVNGRDITAAYPDRDHIQYTKKQAVYQNIFKQAAAYASDILHDPEKKRAYEKKIRNGERSEREKNVYHYAVQEFMKLHSRKVAKNTVQDTLKRYREAFQLNERETKVIRYLAAQEQMSNADYRRMTGLAKPTATKHLAILVKKGLISGSSRGAGAVYRLVPLPGEQIGSF
jgi:uncharacterized membrane protein